MGIFRLGIDTLAPSPNLMALDETTGEVRLAEV